MSKGKGKIDLNTIKELRGDLVVALSADQARQLTEVSGNRDAKRIHDHLLPELYQRIRNTAAVGGSSTQMAIYFERYGDRYKAGADLLMETMMKQGFRATRRDLQDADDGMWSAVEVSW